MVAEVRQVERWIPLLISKPLAWLLDGSGLQVKGRVSGRWHDRAWLSRADPISAGTA